MGFRRTTSTPYFLDEEVRISGLSHDGRGIARYQGKTVFVDGALPDETVRVQVLEDKRRFMNARVKTVVASSPDRCEPVCHHFKQCGGCSLQYSTHDAQLNNKQKIVVDQLQRFARIPTVHLDDALKSEPFGYRHRSRLSIRWQKGQLRLGFREKASKAICDIDECPILAEPLQALPALLRALLPTLKGRESISHAELLLSHSDRGILLRHIRPLSEADRQLLKDFCKENGLFMYLQPAPDIIEPCYPNDGSDIPLFYSLDFPADYPLDNGRLHLHFRPQDFTQVNRRVNQAMVEQAMDWLSLSGHENVLDLFCGIGNFSLPIALQAGYVCGVEGSQASVEQASHNARINGINNAEFFCTDLAQAFDQHPWAKKQYDIVVLDPPRAGADFMIDHLANLLLDQLLYISCNPATLARDAGALLVKGYQLSRLSVIDMFPQTAHVETMALFTR